jgi:hypothetical protein
MYHRPTRRVMSTTLMGIAALAAAACGDARLDKLSAGIARDSALKVINEGASSDSMARVYKQETYLLNGKMTNVLFYNSDGIRQATDSTLPAEKQTPIVIVDGKVAGWGWTYYDSVAKANNIPVPARQ